MDDNKQAIKKEDYIFGLDIGASKVNLFVGISEGDSVRVVECGDFPLANADEYDLVVETLQQAVQQLERSAGVDVRDVYVGIPESMCFLSATRVLSHSPQAKFVSKILKM